ncbi:MAG: hypothetical protein ABSF51_09890 [Verrucomicrobiota bacterium]
MASKSVFQKGNYRINRFLGVFAVVWAIDCGMLNSGYSGTQSLEFQSFFLWQIPFNKIRSFGENGNYVPESFFSAFKSTRNQTCAANLITPTIWLGLQSKSSLPSDLPYMTLWKNMKWTDRPQPMHHSIAQTLEFREMPILLSGELSMK